MHERPQDVPGRGVASALSMIGLHAYDIGDRVAFVRPGWAHPGRTGTVYATPIKSLGTLVISLDEAESLIEAPADWQILFRVPRERFAMAAAYDVVRIAPPAFDPHLAVGDRVTLSAPDWAPIGATGRVAAVLHPFFGPYVVCLDKPLSMTFAPHYWLERWDISQGCFALATAEQITPG